MKLMLFIIMIFTISCTKDPTLRLEGTTWYTIVRTDSLIWERTYNFISENKVNIECKFYKGDYEFNTKFWRTKGNFNYSYSYEDNKLTLDNIWYNVKIEKNSFKLCSLCCEQLLTKDRVIQ